MSRQLGAAVTGGNILISESGSGPPVLLLHGGPGLSDYMGPVADELETAFRVVRFQQRGVAPSTGSGPFSVERHMADAAAVLEAVGAERAYVVGHSWGGHLAMHFAARYQERVLGLVAVDPLGAVPDGGAADLGRILIERTPSDQVARAVEIDERADAGQGTAEEFLERLAIVWPGYFSSPDKAPPMPPLSVSLECFAQTFASIAEHFDQRALEDSLPTVRVPAVFLLGADSPIPPEHGVASAALMPGARCIVEEGCGHLVWLERPGSVRRALETIA
jgi:pimeloyl-ACP methyl ester carboxylesterase